MQAKSIEEVIQQLDNIIDWAQSNKSRLGYFAALYRKVTLKGQEGITEGSVEDGERLERLDVIFANRYLEAIEQHRDGKIPTASWQLAFEASKRYWPIVLQHLLLGMNAHINLDLGIAAARTSPGEGVHDLKNDFNKINEILAALVDGVERELARIWPVLKLLDRIAGKTDEAVINFSIEKARDHAWKVAEDLAPLEQTDQTFRINELDKEVAILGGLIRNPGLIVGLVTKIIRLGERGTVSEIINILR
jgi:hypothetical protein